MEKQQNAETWALLSRVACILKSLRCIKRNPYKHRVDKNQLPVDTHYIKPCVQLSNDIDGIETKHKKCTVQTYNAKNYCLTNTIPMSSSVEPN